MVMSRNPLELSQSNLIGLTSSNKKSRDGYSFDMHSNKWNLNKDVIISFQSEVLEMELKTLDGFRKALARYAEELSAKHTLNMYHRFQRMVRDTKCTSIDEIVIRNWRSMLDETNEWYLGSLRGFLISWYDFGYSGISRKVVDALESMRLIGNEKGVAVANRCPYSGAFTQNEQLVVSLELIRLFSNNLISLPCYSYLVTLQATARRPIQIRQLKSADLIKENCLNTGATNFYLNIPRAKQRGKGFREEFKKLAITEELYLTLRNLSENVEKRLENILGYELSTPLRMLVPIFCDWKIAEQLLFNGYDEQQLESLLETDLLHLSTNYLRDDFMRRVNLLNEAISERTGEVILISARRFRRTRGTNLGRKGISAFIIAEALDQSDTQNVKVYTENTADTVTYIDKAIGKQLAPFAQAFKGEIIVTLSDGERGDDPTGYIPNIDNDVVGACGTNDFCIKGYESCYLCEKFRPLLDAPHQKFLDGLYLEKDRRLKTSKSEDYASTKDTLILAVEWVVKECDRIKSEHGGQKL